VTFARLATAADAPGISRVHVDSWRSAYAGLMPGDAIASRTYERRLAYWSELLSEPPRPLTATWVLEHDGVIVGFAATGPCRDDDRAGAVDAELYAIYLSPDHWGGGRGWVLAEAALRGLPFSAESVSLWVLAGNDRARAFYEALGFRPDGAEREEVLGVPIAEVRMVRDLPYP
jgi:GNAT superfamily N-acetyltransferase